jgi:hypothetical protein
MTPQNNPEVERMITPALIKRMLVGGGIALVLIALFLSPVTSDPTWGRFWMIRPLIVVPLAGAAGAAFYHFVDVRYQPARKRILVDLICLVVYVVGLWMGTVLGLAGTLWN